MAPKKLTLKQKVAIYESFLDELATWRRPTCLMQRDQAETVQRVRDLLNQTRGLLEESQVPTEREPKVQS